VAARTSGAPAAARTYARAALARPCRSGFVRAAGFDAGVLALAAAPRTAASVRAGRSAFVSVGRWGVCSLRALVCSGPPPTARRKWLPARPRLARPKPVLTLLRLARPKPVLALLRRARSKPMLLRRATRREQATLRRRRPNQYRCRQSMEESRGAGCAAARSRWRRQPRVAAWMTCDQERPRARLPPYSRLSLGLTHRKCRQAMEAFRSSETARRASRATPVHLYDQRSRAAQTAGAPKIRTFGSVNSSTAKRTPSRPRPESFMPP
jgi:hypothetical protein